MAVAAPKFAWGINSHVTSANPYNSPLGNGSLVDWEHQLQSLKELGVNIVRFNVNPDYYAPNVLAALQSLRANGFYVYVVLDALSLATVESNAYWQSYTPAAAFAETFIDTYGEYITWVGLSNELNIYSLIANGEFSIDGTQYAGGGAPDGSNGNKHYETLRVLKAHRYLQGLYDGVKASDATMPTGVSISWAKATGFIDAVTQAREWDGNNYDALEYDFIDMHHYSEAGIITRLNYDSSNALTKLLTYGKDIIFGEFGRRDGSKVSENTQPTYDIPLATIGELQAQADYIARTMPIYRGMSDSIKGIFIYQHLDQPDHSTATERYYGVESVETYESTKFRHQFYKPAFYAIRDSLAEIKRVYSD